MDRETLLRFRAFFESAPWVNFQDWLSKEVSAEHLLLEQCPLDKIENVRGTIRAYKKILRLQEDARRAYREREND